MLLLLYSLRMQEPRVLSRFLTKESDPCAAAEAMCSGSKDSSALFCPAILMLHIL